MCRVAHTCIFAVHVGTVLFVLILSIRPKAYCVPSSYIFPVVQNSEDLSIKLNIDLVSTEYPRPRNSTWLNKGEENI